MDCIVIDSPEELLDKLLYEMAVDIMEEGGHDLSPVEASALERAEVERRLNVYLEQLPEYQDRISFVFERKWSSKIISVEYSEVHMAKNISAFHIQRAKALFAATKQFLG